MDPHHIPNPLQHRDDPVVLIPTKAAEGAEEVEAVSSLLT